MRSTSNLCAGLVHAQQKGLDSLTPEVFAPQTCLFAQLGQIGYVEAWDTQKAIARRREHGSTPDSLLLLEHPHTYTLGRRGKVSDVLVGDLTLRQMDVQVCQVDRGGEVTYHGPGQLVVYPIVDVRPIGGAVTYVRTLEQILINTLKDFGLTGHREENLTGVWVAQEKIAAIGVKISRGITTHGLALNVSPNLSYFQHIVPCGLKGITVTSMERLLGYPVSLRKVALRLVHHFGLLFDRRMEEAGQAPSTGSEQILHAHLAGIAQA